MGHCFKLQCFLGDVGTSESRSNTQLSQEKPELLLGLPNVVRGVPQVLQAVVDELSGNEAIALCQQRYSKEATESPA